ncbi:MAG: DUF4013 domain-containing protein [Haloplanus sp.]
MTLDFDSSLRWPRRTDDGLHALLVGTLLVLSLPLVVPSVLLAGYAVRLLRTDPGDDPLPSFADVRSLADAGARATAVVVAYHLPPLALLAAQLHTYGAGARSGFGLFALGTYVSRPAMTAGLLSGPSASPVGSAVLAVAVVTLPVCSYLASVALTRYATTGRLAPAFEVRTVARRAASGAVLRAWLAATLVAFVGGVLAAVVAGALAPVPGVGAVVGGAVRFYATVVGVGVWTSARPETTVETPSPRRSTAPA